MKVTQSSVRGSPRGFFTGVPALTADLHARQHPVKKRAVRCEGTVARKLSIEPPEGPGPVSIREGNVLGIGMLIRL